MNISLNNLTFDDNKWHNQFMQEQLNATTSLQNFQNQNWHLNHKKRGWYYQKKQHQGSGNYFQYEYNGSVVGLLVRQVYAMNKLPPLPRGPALATTVNTNRSGNSDLVERDQCSTWSTSYQQTGNSFSHRWLRRNHMWMVFLRLCMV